MTALSEQLSLIINTISCMAITHHQDKFPSLSLSPPAPSLSPPFSREIL